MLVTEPIENAISGLSGVDTITSTSSEGSSSVIVQLADGADPNQADIDIQQAMGPVSRQLPQNASAPVVRKFDPNASPVLNICVHGCAAGSVVRRCQQPDSTRTEIINVVPQGLFSNIQDIQNVVITDTPTSGPIRIGDVANVTQTYKQQFTLQRLNGQDAVGLSITPNSDANTVQVANAVESELKTLEPLLPQGSSTTVVNDQSVFTRASLDSIQRDLALAVILVAAVILVFLHDWKHTVIVLCAIPTSLISTFLVMYLLGFSLNTMSMMALALMIGILVDDSIVVLENIHRHLQMGERPWQAALNGRTEIGLAAQCSWWPLSLPRSRSNANDSAIAQAPPLSAGMCQWSLAPRSASRSRPACCVRSAGTRIESRHRTTVRRSHSGAYRQKRCHPGQRATRGCRSPRTASPRAVRTAAVDNRAPSGRRPTPTVILQRSIPPAPAPSVSTVALLDQKRAMDRREAVVASGLALLLSCAARRTRRNEASPIAIYLVGVFSLVALACAGLSFFELP